MSSPTGAGMDLLAEVDLLIRNLEQHPDPAVREQVVRLLAVIDTVHRTGLSRLMHVVHGMAGDAFVNKLTADPAVRLLLMSYDLVATDRRLQAEEALDTVRGHLHGHGMDVEIADVVGGVVYVRVHGVPPGDAPDKVRRDVEAALKEGLLGFQELVIGERQAQRPSTLIPLGSLARARGPIYQRAVESDRLAPGALLAVQVDAEPVLLVRLAGEVYAVRNRCGESPLPLEFGRLEDAEIVCSWHGCRYDVRSGRLKDGALRLVVFPVREHEGAIEVAVGTAPVTSPERACGH